jgi:ATP-dependent DNA helicase DinG
MLDDELKQSIQQSYSRFLNARELKPRHGQKLMIADIARTLGSIELDAEGIRQNSSHICVVEAGTGTGKTIAYLLATLPIAKALGKKVVIATATVALQEQIVFKDLPELKRNAELDFEFALAKGRGRYLCLTKLDRILSGSDMEPTIPLVEDDWSRLNEADMGLYQDMMQTLAQNQWDGDRDSWPQELEHARWQRVTTDHRQCTGRRCSHVRNCSFFKAREAINDVDCVVANHDLVLADLALGGGAILPAPEDAIYIFDEAHHLPDKALNHFASHARVQATSRWLGQGEGQWENIIDPLADAVYFTQLAADVPAELKRARQLLDALYPQLEPFIQQADPSQMTVRYRFAQGQVPDFLEEQAQALAAAFADLSDSLTKLNDEVSKLLESEHSAVPLVDLENTFALLGSWCARAEANLELWTSYAHTTPKPNWPIARWITLVEFGGAKDFELVSSPILAAHTLRDSLWSRCCGAIATSATLTALGSFDRFRYRAGTPDDATYSVVPSPFNYAEAGQLVVPREALEAGDATAHTASIVDLLPKVLEVDEASLVLFSSRRQMQGVFDELPDQWRDRILVQGTGSKQSLLDEHRRRIREGQGSVLFGLASFAEGLDLPGDQCKHVVIAKIPFAVPDDPVEAALAEWIEAQGGNAFMQITVPDAAIKLVQACGRLLRTESDTGRVTLLDKRIVTKRYGKAILNSLPPFARRIG